MLGVGFAQTLSFNAPKNAANQPFRVGVDGQIPVPVNTAVTSPVVPAKPFGETLSFTLDPNVKDPYNHAIDITVQREMPGNMLLEVGYLGRYARNLYQNLNLNSTPYFHKDKVSGQRFSQAFDAVAKQLRAGTPAASVTAQPWFTNQIPALGAGATSFLAANAGASFIDGNLNNLWNLFIDFFTTPHNNQQSLDLFVRSSNGRSAYNAMFVTLHKRMSRGFAFDVNYTLSKSRDQIGGIQNFVSQLSSSFDPEIDYAPSDFDRTHNLNVNFVYDLPFGKDRRFSAGNFADNLIGGWYVAGIYTASSGVPLTVVQSFQAWGSGAVFGTAAGAIPTGSLSGVGNNLNRGVAGSGGIGTSGNPATKGTGLNLFADPAAVFNLFRKINLDSDTSSGRGVLRGFSRWNLDFTLGKETRFGENIRFTLTADLFNVFNRVNFNNPGLSLTNQATFGVVTSAFGSRRIQIGGRFAF